MASGDDRWIGAGKVKGNLKTAVQPENDAKYAKGKGVEWTRRSPVG